MYYESLEELKERFNKRETLFNQYVEDAKTAFSDEEVEKLFNKAFEVFDDLGSLVDKLNELDNSFEWTKRYMACSSKLVELSSISMERSFDSPATSFFKTLKRNIWG
ncbi:hypothetical protein [Helicobacter cetorum]|uniref:Uncharacterized protein n=1 Tax=Helicobacter cetorum (strain ATCC BAA-429 / MIT 00-7128) TaxID=182217 RepID=I0EPX9_HELC0|nr:hypothetical protein [Helicobacter cetorum]AFI04998.1 hypothetical protein HCW_08715 [Helicobacter cetorum MIT 00-7128]